MHIRRATVSDVEALVRVKRPGIGKHYPVLEERQIRRLARVDKGLAAYLLAERDGEVIGHVFLKFTGTGSAPGYPDIEDLYVREDCRGNGIGGLLISTCEEIAVDHGFARIGLSVNPVLNGGARRLYERLGYRDVGRPPHLDGVYAGVEDWCIEMAKSLTPSGAPSVLSKNE